MQNMIAKHREQNAEHQAKFEAWLAETFRPLTPDELVFKVVDVQNNSVFWTAFDPVTCQDVTFDSHSAALAFASGHI